MGLSDRWGVFLSAIIKKPTAVSTVIARTGVSKGGMGGMGGGLSGREGREKEGMRGRLAVASESGKERKNSRGIVEISGKMNTTNHRDTRESEKDREREKDKDRGRGGMPGQLTRQNSDASISSQSTNVTTATGTDGRGDRGDRDIWDMAPDVYNYVMR